MFVRPANVGHAHVFVPMFLLLSRIGCIADAPNPGIHLGRASKNAPYATALLHTYKLILKRSPATNVSGSPAFPPVLVMNWKSGLMVSHGDTFME